MNWDAAGAIGEIVGAIAVVATLLYLSRQIRENSRQLKLTSLTDTNNVMNDAFAPIYNSDKTMEIWATGGSYPDKLNEQDREIFLLLMTRLMAAFDTIVEHHELGTINDERFSNHANFVSTFLASAGGKLWQAQSRYEFSSAAKLILAAEK